MIQRLTALLLLLLTAQVAAEKIGSVSFTAPPGWTVKLGEAVATLTPAGGAAAGMILLIPDQVVSGDVQTWFAATVKSLSSDGQITEDSDPRQITSASGQPLILKALKIKTAQAVQTRTYMAALNGKKATLYVLVTTSDAALKSGQAVLIALVNSTAAPQSTATPGTAQTSPAPTASGSLLGKKVALPDVKPMNAAQFRASGGDPERATIPDEFRCYREQASGSLSPELILQILPGGQYRTPYGGGSYVIKQDGSLTKTDWRGGPLGGSYGYLNLENHGQRLSLNNVGEGVLERSLSFECYQRGGLENLMLAQFRRRTPAPGTYPCVKEKGSGQAAGTIEILPGGAYRYGGQTGRFTTDIRSDQSEDWGKLEFTGGGLDEAIGSYLPRDGGLREVSIYRPELRCRAIFKDEPLPVYGTARAPAPPGGSGGLSGGWAGWNVDVGGSCGGLCWSFYFFDKSGYVYTHEPDTDLADADCSRTYPNGLPICEVYRVQGGSLVIGNDKPEKLEQVGGELKIGGQRYQAIVPLSGLKLNAKYQASSGFGNAMSTTVSSFQSSYSFTGAGKFVYGSSGGVMSTTTTTGTPQGEITGGVTATSQNGSSGAYRFVGNTLELRYPDGRTEKRFAFALPGKDGKPNLDLIRIGGSSFTEPDRTGPDRK
ncbi:hypothetical protein [Deinococcus sp.]|uniref:hypothetical protein n=1 Tax=Deinococcus sp. TaxID=47478 RepID=UPI0025FDA37E|nr:hypothetical protein [Deinococcus sp.]